jgi:hypothetical protein
VVVVNKDPTQNLKATVQVPETATSASLTVMTQSSGGATLPDILATSGVTIQGASVAADGSFTPSAPYMLRPAGSLVPCYVPALSAVLLHID